jgi:hypothetical protein
MQLRLSLQLQQQTRTRQPANISAGQSVSQPNNQSVHHIALTTWDGTAQPTVTPTAQLVTKHT